MTTVEEVHGPAGLFHPDNLADPAPVYRTLRQTGRLHPAGERIFVVPHYAECDAVLGDPAWGQGYFAGINPFRPGVDPSALPGSFLLMDPPDHTRLRGLVSRGFTARRVAGLQEQITATVDSLLDEILDAGEVDLVPAFANAVPLITIGTMLGIPPADSDRLRGWISDVSRGLDLEAWLTPDEISARREALIGFDAYFRELIPQRRAEPGDDLISQLTTVRDSGDQLSERELRDICLLLLIAGNDTTRNLIANGVLALARNPAQQQWLAAHPERAGDAVEEFLRYDTPVPLPHRVALEDRELAGRRLPRGTGLILAVGSANRDPAAYHDPDRLDLERFAPGRDTRRHLSFTHGMHFCLGAPLARLEGRIVFERLLRRAPRFRLGTARPTYRPSVSMRGPERLPVILRPEGPLR